MMSLRVLVAAICLAGFVCGQEDFEALMPELDQLPNATVLSVGVLMDHHWVRRMGADPDNILNILKSAVEYAKSDFPLTGIIMSVEESSTFDPYETEHRAMVSLMDCKETEEWSESLAANEIVHVAVSARICRRPKTGILLPLHGEGQDVAQLIMDLRDHNTLTWSSMTVIHDDSLSMMNQMEIHQVLDDRHVAVTMLKISDLSSEMKTLPEKDLKNRFLVIIKKDMVATFINLAKEKRMFHTESQFVIMVPDTHSKDKDMTPFIEMGDEGFNLAFIFNTSVKADAKTCKLGLQCLAGEAIRILGRGTQARLEEEMSKFLHVDYDVWEAISPSWGDRMETTKKMMQNIQAGGGGGCNKCNKWDIEAVEIKNEGSPQKLNVGSWRPNNGLSLLDDILPHVHGHFRGRVIEVGTIDYTRWMQITKDDSGNITEVIGILPMMLRDFGEVLNFTVNYVEPKDGSWGFKDRKGNWDGMIKQLMDEEVLFAAAPIPITSERMEVVNFSRIIGFEHYKFMFKNPTYVSKTKMFIDPLGEWVWVCITIVVVCMGPTIWLVHRSCPTYKHYDMVNNEGMFRLQNSMWYSFTGMISAGMEYLPESDSGRVLIGFYLLFVTITAATYAGNLCAFLLAPAKTQHWDWIQEVADEASSWGTNMVPGNMVKKFMDESPVELYNYVGYWMYEYPDYPTPDSPIYEWMWDHKFVYFERQSVIEELMEQRYQLVKKCDTQMSYGNLFTEQVAFAFQKNSPYLEWFNERLEVIEQMDLMTAWKRLMIEPNECTEELYPGSGVTGILNVTDLQGGFIVIFTGMASGFVAFIVECIVGCCWKWKEKKKKKNKVKQMEIEPAKDKH